MARSQWLIGGIKILALTVFIGLVLWVTTFTPYRNGPPIRGDGSGYHVWVYGLKYGDISFWKHQNVEQGIAHIDKEKQRVCIKYPPGVALMQLLLGGFLCNYNYETATISEYDHQLILLIGAILLFLTVLLLYKTLLLLNVSPIVSIVAVGAYLFGAGLFHYGTYDASMSHIYSAFGISALLYLTFKNNSQKTWTVKSVLLFGILSFWIFLVRNTNGAMTLAIMAFALIQYVPHVPRNNNTNSITYKFKGFRRHLNLQVAIAWAVGTGIGLCLIVLYIYYATGVIGLSTYRAESFPSYGAYTLDVLISYERGLITYYPIFLLTAILSLFASRDLVTYAFIIFVLFYAFVYGSWSTWNLGGGFGHRGFVEVGPFGVLALGLALGKIAKTWLMPISILALLVCCFVSTKIMCAYWERKFPFMGGTARLYWSTLIPGIKIPMGEFKSIVANYNNDLVELMVDRNMATRWHSGQPQKDDMTITLEMANERILDKVVMWSVLNGSDYPRGLALRRSLDGIEWIDIDIVHHDNTTFLFEPVPCRFLEIRQTGHSEQMFWAVDELYLYGPILTS